ncbi:hypothetical protein KCU61_g1265, partial [Aureobasidium melanogenum]
MAQIVNDMWNQLDQLKEDIEVMLGDSKSDLPSTLDDARARQAPGQEEFVALQERLYEVRAFLQSFVEQVNAIDPSKTQLLDNLTALQRQIDNVPSMADYNAAKEELKQCQGALARVETEERRNLRQVSGPSVFTTPLDPTTLHQSLIQVQAAQHTRVFEQLLGEATYSLITASATAVYAACAGAEAYSSAISTGQSQEDALAAADQATNIAAANRSEEARAAGEEAHRLAKERGRSSPLARVASDTASLRVLLGDSNDQAQFVARRAMEAAHDAQSESAGASDQTGGAAPGAVPGAAGAGAVVPGALPAAGAAGAGAVPAGAPGGVPGAAPAAGATAASANTVTATQFQAILTNVGTAVVNRTPLQIEQAVNNGIRVGDGTTNIAGYPRLPGSLKQPVIDRLAQDFLGSICKVSQQQFDYHFTGNIHKTTCLFAKVKSQKADVGAAQNYACATCEKMNRICLARTDKDEIYIAPLAPDVRVPGADLTELGAWVCRPAETMNDFGATR